MLPRTAGASAAIRRIRSYEQFKFVVSLQSAVLESLDHRGVRILQASVLSYKDNLDSLSKILIANKRTSTYEVAKHTLTDRQDSTTCSNVCHTLLRP